MSMSYKYQQNTSVNSGRMEINLKYLRIKNNNIYNIFLSTDFSKIKEHIIVYNPEKIQDV